MYSIVFLCVHVCMFARTLAYKMVGTCWYRSYLNGQPQGLPRKPHLLLRGLQKASQLVQQPWQTEAQHHELHTCPNQNGFWNQPTLQNGGACLGSRCLRSVKTTVCLCHSLSIHSIGCFGITMAWITTCFDWYFMIFIFWLVSMSSYVLIYINRKLYIQLYSCVFMCVCLHWPSPIKWLVHVGTVPISMASLRGFRWSLIFSCGGFRRRRSWCISLGSDNEIDWSTT